MEEVKKMDENNNVEKKERKEYIKEKKKKSNQQKKNVFDQEPSLKFLNEKKLSTLELNDPEKFDKSRAGGVDKDIKEFNITINNTTHMYTTSSCAGRSIVTQSNPSQDEKLSYNIEWVYVTHDMVDHKVVTEAITEKLKKEQGSEVWFKLEPPMVAICCSSVEVAQKIIDFARGSSGIKRSFITGTTDRVMLCVTDTMRIETLIAKNGNFLVSNDYIEIMCQHANSKLEQSRSRFEKLRLAIEKTVPKNK
eukprot:TRINITY_DN3566_c0_g2_i1.p1 TRINITY_DN3566_c0_g2~~TRINITY_DN3566_c0_g2_i1.p1  ORF type:complete len:250 (-),score=70.56 TRINITY_DN3566_c0_g2_i1:34-783(-)